MRTLEKGLAVVTGFGLAGTAVVTPAGAAVSCMDPTTAAAQLPQQIANDPSLLAATAASATADAKYRAAMANERAIRKLYNTALAAKNRKTTSAKHKKAIADYKKVAARLGKAKIASAAALEAAGAASNRLTAIRSELETGMLETLSAYFCVDPSELALTATPGNDSVALTWTPVEGADSYVVMRGGERLGVTEDARIVDSSAHNGVTYDYTLYALVDSQPNVVGDPVAPLDLSTSTVLAIATASATPALPIPTNVRATAAVYGATITWSRVANATAYQIRRDGLLIGSTTGYTYADAGLVYGVSHSYTVSAVEGSIVSAESASASASPRAAVLSAPTGLVAIAGNKQVSLSWTPMPGAIRYVVYRDRIKLLETTSVDINDLGLSNRQTYEYRVSAINIAGESVWSTYVVATPRLPSPTDVVATPGDEEASLSWTAVPDANGYAIWLDGSQIATTNSTTATVTGLSNGIEYELAVSALDNGVSSLRVKVEDVVPSPLVVPAPTGLAGSAGNGQVSLTWNPVDIATSYNIIRGNTIVGTSTNASFVDSALTNGQTYSYTIQAVHGKRTSPQSAAATATPVGAIPVIPTNFSATAGNATVTLNWTISLDATGYRLYRDGVLIASPVTNTYTDAGLTNGQTYLYTIAAFSTGGSSPQSAAISAKPVAAAPGMPTGVAATPGDARVVLTWNAVTGATSYQVYRNGVLAGTTLAAAFTDTGLVNGNSYSYTVVAVNSGGSSAASAAVSAVPTVPAPTTPTGLAATAGNAQVLLSWTPVLGATGYDIYRDGVIIASTASSSYTDIAVLNGSTYLYAVRATNAGGASAASTTVSARPMPPLPATPTGVTATPGSSQVALTWTAVTGADSYKVYRNGVLIAQPTTNSFLDTGLVNGTSYTYTISAVNIAGSSALSAGVSATPAGTSLAAPTGLAATPATRKLSWCGTPLRLRRVIRCTAMQCC